MSTSFTRDIANVAQKSIKGRAPVIAAVLLCSALGTVAVAKIPTAVPSAPTASTAEQRQATVAAPPASTIQPAVLTCEQQTWPYIDRACESRASGAAAKKRLVRVISPETARVTELAQGNPPVSDAVASAQSPVAETFASLSRPSIVPAQKIVPDAQAQRDAAAAVAPEAPAVRQVAAVKRPVQAKKHKSAAIRTAYRTDRPSAYSANAQVVAQGENYQVRRVYLEPDVAHGLY